MIRVRHLGRAMDMRASRFTEEQIIGILREQDAGAKTAEVCRRHGISSTLVTRRWPVTASQPEKGEVESAPEDTLRMWPVSKRVSKPGNTDDATLIEPVALHSTAPDTQGNLLLH